MRRFLAPVVLAGSALGCATEVESFTTDARSGTTQALVAVERSTTVASPATARSGALAQLVHASGEVEGRAVLGLVSGLGALPAADECAVTRPAASTVGGLAPAELLELGTVTLEAGGLASTLAPHAFPTVTDVISGVVYTTRDRSPLPEGLEYTLTTSGTPLVPALEVTSVAPVAPTDATLDGIALADVETLAPNHPFELAWTPGHPDDLVVLRLVAADAEPVACAFPADRGVGTVSGASFAGRGVGRLSVHRVRRTEFVAPGIDRAELRFDFDVSTTITFVD